MSAERHVTEEGFPVRTIYVSYFPMNITRGILCDYFRKFGAVERAQVYGVRLNIFQAGPSARPPEEENFYGYVTYVNTLGASDALEYQQQHEVQGHKVNIEPAFTWNQPSADLDRYEVDHKEPPLSTETKKLYQEIQATLNDDCIYQVMGHLNVFDLITMAKFGPTFLRVVKQIRTLIICRCNGNPITLMELRSILHVLGLGSSVVNLTISLKSFNSSSQRFICDRLFQYIGGQLKSLTLDSFGVTVEQFELMKPLLFRLIYLDIDFSYNFDYRRFNCEWPNLQVLRIRSSGYIDTFIDQIDSVPEFPRLKKLMIASGYRLHANLFERLHRVCAKITDLVVISVDDYYSEMSPLVLRNTDLDNLSRFTELKRLHLSFSRSYLKDTIINVICSLRHLKYLTLEITNVRLQEDRAVIDTINRNLRRIGMCLINIKEIQLSGIMLNEDHLLEMITSAPSLESLCIHECGYQMTEHCIRSVISYRSNLSMGNHPPLKIIVDEFINKNCPLKRAIENALIGNEKYVIFESSSDKNIINKGYIKETEVRQVVRNANFRQIRMAHNRDGDPFRVRNRIFLFRP